MSSTFDAKKMLATKMPCTKGQGCLDHSFKPQRLAQKSVRFLRHCTHVGVLIAAEDTGDNMQVPAGGTIKGSNVQSSPQMLVLRSGPRSTLAETPETRSAESSESVVIWATDMNPG